MTDNVTDNVDSNNLTRLVGVISEYNSYYANDYGWDPHSSCKSNFAAKGPADQCCGTFPTRFPFSTEGGARGCCGEKPYSLSALGGVSNWEI